MANTTKTTQASTREARLAAALRENLKRRKAQARGRDTAAGAGDGQNEAAEPAAEEGGTPAHARPRARRKP